MANSVVPPAKANNDRSIISKTVPQLSLSIVALGLLAVVILFVQSTFIAESRSRRGQQLTDLLKVNVSTTLTVVRTAQGLLSAISAIALKNAFISLQWRLMNTPDGLPYLSMLALSPTTDNVGAVKLITTSVTRLTSKLWAISRRGS